MSDVALVPAHQGPTFRSVFDGLSGGHQAFVLAYVQHHCAQRAARDAGYSPASARTQAGLLLGRQDVSLAIRLFREEQASLARFDHVKYLAHLNDLTYADFSGCRIDAEGQLVVPEGKEHLHRVVQRVKFRITTSRDGSTKIEGEYQVPNRVESARLLGQATGVLPAEQAMQDAQPSVVVVGVTAADLMGPPRQ